MPRAPRRPKPAHVADLRARVVGDRFKEGRWYWRIWRTRNGREETVQAGWWTELEIDRVVAALVTTGVDTPRARNRVETLHDLLAFWLGALEERRDLATETLRLRRAALRHLDRVIGAVLLDSVDRLVIERYRDRRLGERVHTRRKVRVDGEPTGAWEDVDAGRFTAPRTVVQEIGFLRMAWRWGREVGIVPARDLPRIPIKVQGHVRNRKTPTPEETALVLRELDGWARLALVLYAGTGARLNEIAGLRWRQVDLGAEELHVQGKRGVRVVPLAPPLVAALQAVGPGSPEDRVLACALGTARAIYDRLDVACKHAGVSYFAPGGLRRAVVRALYRSGEDPSVAGAVVGHCPEVAMRHYREVTEAEKREAIRKAKLGFLPDPDQKVVDFPQRAKS